MIEDRVRNFRDIFNGLKRANGCTKVGPIQDQGVYQIAKSFADKVGKGAVEVKHGSDESKTDSPY